MAAAGQAIESREPMQHWGGVWQVAMTRPKMHGTSSFSLSLKPAVSTCTGPCRWLHDSSQNCNRKCNCRRIFSRAKRENSSCWLLQRSRFEILKSLLAKKCLFAFDLWTFAAFHLLQMPSTFSQFSIWADVYFGLLDLCQVAMRAMQCSMCPNSRSMEYLN